jgi:hypothetical protein
MIVNMGVCFVSGTSDQQMHDSIHRIEADLGKAYPEIKRVYIEAETLAHMKKGECAHE